MKKFFIFRWNNVASLLLAALFMFTVLPTHVLAAPQSVWSQKIEMDAGKHADTVKVEELGSRTTSSGVNLALLTPSLAPLSSQTKIRVQFINANGEQIGTDLEKETNAVIGKEEVPIAPTVQNKDFLGWFWGPGLKYEAIFPMSLSSIPGTVLKRLNGTLEIVPRYGKNIPANPIAKPGYRLIFSDEFDGTTLDTTKWVDKYLSSWSVTPDRTKEWMMHDGQIELQIKAETEPWCAEFDGQTVVSGFTTGQRNGLHNWNGSNTVRNAEDMQLTHINQYGYYEMRAKGQSGSSRHSAWWLLGFEDIPTESAEIDIFEVLGKNNHSVPPAVHAWKDTAPFQAKPTSYTSNNDDFNNEWHVYGFDWQKGTGSGNYPDKIIFYIDGKSYAEINVNIKYPLIQLFSLYEKREGGWTGPWEWMPYPNSFDIDYVRVYKKLPMNANTVASENLRVEKVQAEDIKIHRNRVTLKTYRKIDGSIYTEKTLPGTKSYVRVTWNDGVETQEPVIWEPITNVELAELSKNEELVKVGHIPSINRSVTMKIQLENPTLLPYSSENLLPVLDASLSYVFDGKIGETEGAVPSGEFRVEGNNFRTKECSISYDFKKSTQLSGVHFWTNYGAGQGVTSFRLAVWDSDINGWKPIENNKEYQLNWGDDNSMRQLGVTFPSVMTNKVKIIITGANLKWSNKFSVREITFDTVVKNTSEIDW